MNLIRAAQALFFLLSFDAVAQSDSLAVGPDTAACATVELVRYSSQRAGRVVETGLVIERSLLPCRLSQQGSSYLLALGPPGSQQPGLPFPCAGLQPGKPFNGRVNGQRVGIWVARYPGGRIRRLRAYNQAGKRYRSVRLRLDGTVASSRSWGSYRRPEPVRRQLYDQQGRRIGGARGFH